MRAFFNFLFKGEIPRSVSVRRVKVQTETEGRGEAGETLRFKLVAFFSWVLAIVLVVCLIGVFALLFTDRSVPPFLPPIITGVIGYFGGAIAAYFGVRSA